MMELKHTWHEKVSRSGAAPFSRLERKEALQWLEEGAEVSFITHPLFEADDAYEQVMGDEAVESLPPVPPRHLLKPEQEVRLFVQYNYCRYRWSRIEAGQTPSNAVLKELMRWRRGARIRRDRLVECNMGLVPMMIQMKRFQSSEFDELISAGHMALLNAVDKFDANRGFRFSTYACRSIERAVGQAMASRRRYNERRTQLNDDVAEPAIEAEFSWDEPSTEILLLREVLHRNEARLTDMERNVLKHRFPVAEVPAPREAMTRNSVAELIGVTKERIRQVERSALAKLRRALEREIIE